MEKLSGKSEILQDKENFEKSQLDNVKFAKKIKDSNNPVQLTLKNQKGNDLVDIREMQSKDGLLNPSKKGISLNINEFNKILDKSESLKKYLEGNKGENNYSIQKQENTGPTQDESAYSITVRKSNNNNKELKFSNKLPIDKFLSIIEFADLYNDKQVGMDEVTQAITLQNDQDEYESSWLKKKMLKFPQFLNLQKEKIDKIMPQQTKRINYAKYQESQTKDQLKDYNDKWEPQCLD